MGATVRGGGGGFRAVCNECRWLAEEVRMGNGSLRDAQLDADAHNTATH